MVHDTLTLVGELSVWIALLMSAWAAVVSFGSVASGRGDFAASGRRAVYVASAALLLALAGLADALRSHDFAYAYVAAHSTADLPAALSLSALWAGRAGSLLVCAWIFSVFGAWRAASGGAARREERARLAGVVATVLLAATLVLAVVLNPYARTGWVAPDGAGLDPLLRHPLMALARPLLLGGYAAAAAGLAIGIAGIMGDVPRTSWSGGARTCALAAWTLLSAGLAATLRGAYLHAGAAGLWWAAPATTGAAAAWLATAGALHAMRRRGAARVAGVGEHVAHVGAALAAAALLAGAFVSPHALDLRTGQEARVADGLGHQWRFVSQGVSRYGASDHDVTAATVESWRDGATAGLLVARRLTYGGATDASARTDEVEPAVRPSPVADLRVVLDSAADDRAWLRVAFAPLAWLFWMGAILAVAGGVAALGFGPPTDGAPAEER
jgi:cytochrome c biogenesis factor